ncbi:MAG: oligosaccharide flippase family protein [Prolixibacteraceae bacterium]|nr:oligosaccharide flippase family protein [Prolixibacteraceae bacterium]MBT6005350.1 oligosaccharide flippase family protein [Prolixibacteraceae bacterium]MBT6766966.1 oligosaccharide flippase family protein [Prolixibacteraceae bacterium]MBT6997966.1 oligosaccharide flippase family protein [Prolixibacteraceae bacterium]MBT7396024.1 oligosaccharide flippase family protein [Prolixibacteraceae bacterium]
MKRKFVTNLLLLLFLNLLIKPFWIFGIDRTVQNMVGDQSYGLYFALFNFSMILNIFLDVGITSYNNRNIARHNFLLPKHLSNIVGLKFLLAIVYTIFSLGIAAIIGYNKIQFHLLFFLIFNQFLISFTLYLRSNISALHLFRTDSLISVLDRSFMIIICSILLFTNVLGGNFSIEWFVYAQTAAYVLTSLITFAIVLGKSGRIKIQFNLKFFLVFLRKSYPYALLILLMSFYNRIDSVMIERILPDPIGKEQAGIYAQSFRLLDAVSMFGVLFAGLLLPIFSKMIKQKEEVGQMVKLSYTLLIVPAIIIAISSVYYNQEIMAALYKSNTEHSSGILGILMIGFVGIATTYIFGTLLTANGSLKYLNIMAFSGMVLNVVLNLILIPRYHAFGSAYASLTTQIFTAAIQVVLVIVIFKMKPEIKFIIQLLMFVGIVVVFGTVSKSFDNWFYGYLAMISISILFAFFLKLFSLKDLYQIIRYK